MPKIFKKKSFRIIFSIFLALIILLGVGYGILYYLARRHAPGPYTTKTVEYESAYTLEENLERLNKEMDDVFWELKETEFLQDYKLYPVYNFNNQPQFYVVELLGIYDVFNSQEFKDKLKNEWGPLCFSDIDALPSGLIPDSDKEDFKNYYANIEMIKELNLERRDIQVLGVMIEDELKVFRPPFINKNYGTKVIGGYVNDDYTHFSFRQLQVLVSKYGEEKFTIFTAGFSFYEEIDFFSKTHFNGLDSNQPNLITNSPYQDKKLYFGIRNRWQNCIVGYEKDGEIYSLTEDPFYVKVGEKKVGCSTENVLQKIGEYNKIIPKECYQGLSYQIRTGSEPQESFTIFSRNT